MPDEASSGANTTATEGGLDQTQMAQLNAAFASRVEQALMALDLEPTQVDDEHGGSFDVTVQGQLFRVQAITAAPPILRTLVAYPRSVVDTDELTVLRACNQVALTRPTVKAMMTDEAIVCAVDAPLLGQDDLQALLFSNFVRVGVAVNGFREAIGLQPTSAENNEWDWGSQSPGGD